MSIISCTSPSASEVILPASIVTSVAEVGLVRGEQLAEPGHQCAAHRGRCAPPYPGERPGSIGEIVEFGGKASDERRLKGLEQHADARDCGERLSQRHEVAWSGGAECARATSRSISCTPFSVSRIFARSVLRNANSSTASSRSWIRSIASSGRSSHVRSNRPPIEVSVRSIS